jgi:hypothetical protein
MKSLLQYRILIVLIFVARALTVHGQVVINELSSRNATTLNDFDNDHPDWIELLNIGSETVNLKDWYLSDNLNKPDKWKFPEIFIQPDSHLIVFASNKNRKVIVDHWEMAVYAEDLWKYWMPDSEPDAAWKDLGFNDAGWPEGPGGFGRGDGDDNTVLPDTVATVYLRKTFTIPDTSVISFVLLHVDYDDAFVAYLNGIEIARTNIGWPGKIQQWNDISYDVHIARMYQGLPPEEFPIPLELFRSIVHQGENILAVQALNAWNNHGNFSIIPFLSFGIKDTSFTYQEVPEWFGEKPIHLHTNFALSGQGESLLLSDPNLNLMDQVNYPYLKADQSYGRETDGSSNWKYFGQPTPGLKNELSNSYSGYAKEPHFSMNAGFYNDTIEINFLNFQPGDTIRYTIDGSWVTDSSAIYSGEPIVIDSTIVLRAQVYKSGFLPGKVSSNTYIIGYSSTLPVVSISLNPYDLWDWEEGIYVLGPNAESNYPYFGANFWMDWQKPSHIEYFDEQQTQGFELDADLMIHGGFSRAFPMKSLRVIANSKYDDSEINYPLFKDKDISTFKKFVLRNSGHDFNVTHFRDALMHKIVQKETEIDIQDYQPVVVFLNGQYWGIHNMREKIDKNYLNGNFGVNPDSVHLLRTNIKIIQGNYYHYMQMIEYVKTVPLVDSVVYDSIGKLVDVHNYSDYFIAEMYYVNPDWPNNNIKYWRSYADHSRWRYIMTDTDFGLGLYSQVYKNELNRILHANIMYVDNHWILRRLMENADYRRYFINRSADMFNTMLLPQNIVNTIALFKERLAPEMPVHLSRWESTFPAWENNVQALTNFAMNRLPYVWQHYLGEFNLVKLVTVSLDVDSTKHGRIRINTIVPDSLPWQGIYFDGNPVDISAIPDSGYIFSHWKPNMIITGADTLIQHLKVNIDTNDIFIACFVLDPFIPVTPKIVFSEINYRSSDSLDAGDWVEVLNVDTTHIDLSGWIFKDDDDSHEYIFPPETILDTGQYLVICRDTVKFKTVYPDVLNVLGPFVFGLNNEGDSLRLFSSAGLRIASMAYNNKSPWPTDADGTGKTLELVDSSGDLNDGSNWFSGCIGGSPGGPFTECDTIYINEQSGTNHFIRLYPNPSYAQLTLEIYADQNNELTIEVFDVYGNLKLHDIFKVQPNTLNSLELVLTEIPAGVYLIRINGKDLSHTVKFLVR